MTDVDTDPTAQQTATSDIPPPPYDDVDDEPEFRPRPRRRAHALTFALAGAALIAVGFLGGVLLQKHEDRNSTTSAATGGTGRFAATGRGATTGSTAAGGTGAAGAGGGGGRFAGGFGGAAGSGVAGTVTLVDGKNVYVTDTSGNVVKVTTSASSQLTKTDPATTSDVAPGDVVTVRGTQQSDGSYAASQLTIVPGTSIPSGAGG